MMHGTETELFATICQLMSRLTESELKVLLHVARHSLAVGAKEISISIKEMTRGTGLSNRGTITAVQSLTDKQLLAAYKQQDERGGYQPTRYTLGSAALAAEDVQGSEKRSQAGENSSPLVRSKY